MNKGVTRRQKNVVSSISFLTNGFLITLTLKTFKETRISTGLKAM